jgi:hypothetical protein
MASVVENEDAVEYILKDGRQFTVCVTKGEIGLILLIPCMPEGIDVQEHSGG